MEPAGNGGSGVLALHVLVIAAIGRVLVLTAEFGHIATASKCIVPALHRRALSCVAADESPRIPQVGSIDMVRERVADRREQSSAFLPAAGFDQESTEAQRRSQFERPGILLSSDRDARPE